MLSPTDSLINKIRIVDLVSYVEHQGWKRIAYPSSKLIVFEGPRDDDNIPVKLILPSKKEYIDATIRIAEAVELLSIVLEKSVKKIIGEVGQANQTSNKTKIVKLYETLDVVLYMPPKAVDTRKEIILFSKAPKVPPKSNIAPSTHHAISTVRRLSSRMYPGIATDKKFMLGTTISINAKNSKTRKKLFEVAGTKSVKE